MDIGLYFVGKLKSWQRLTCKAGTAHSWHAWARGSTHFYDLPDSTTLEEFKIAAEVAWGEDCDYAEIWGGGGYARVVFF
ncbi:hypothetical protein P7F88_25305 [Vibrio hannami]|uniref:hypothetical protein n=1 Tax=Vibrio hannami TaxID=2717094 RepID=UPI00240F7C7D|nr:hypothetical protein [Vibrio hannami]MDG3089183.1 hypothetical protein [Vibrio hannami]